MDYSTYWSVLDSPSHTIKSNSVFLYISVGAGLLWFLVKKIKKDKEDGDKIILLWATGVFTVFGLGMYILLTFFYKDNSDEQTLKMLNSPTASKVEGVVSNFTRTLYHGKYADVITESFNVDSIKFSYSDAALGKFNSFSQTNNNVIFDGQKVRITYGYGPNHGQNYGVILKLEIAN